MCGSGGFLGHRHGNKGVPVEHQRHGAEPHQRTIPGRLISSRATKRISFIGALKLVQRFPYSHTDVKAFPITRKVAFLYTQIAYHTWIRSGLGALRCKVHKVGAGCTRCPTCMSRPAQNAWPCLLASCMQSIMRNMCKKIACGLGHYSDILVAHA